MLCERCCPEAAAFVDYGGKMKRVLFVLLDLLAAAFLIGGYIVQYFTKRKLGMMRWVTFKTSKIQEAMPVDILKYIAVIVVLLLAVIVIRSFIRKRTDLGMTDVVMAAVMAILALVYLGFTLLITSEVIRSYYLVLPMIGAATLILVLRNSIAIWTCKNEK